MGAERPVGCALHVLVPGAQFAIERVAQNEFEHMDCLERGACGPYVPYEELMGSIMVSIAFVK